MSAVKSMASVLTQLGFSGDPEMVGTPAAFVGLMQEFSSTGAPPPLSLFEGYCKGPVILRDLPYYSLCAHHLLPFFGTASIAYLPDESVAGLGGFARSLTHLARRPQLQERLAQQWLDALWVDLQPKALVIKLNARQLCMEMRGAQSPGSVEVILYKGEGHEALLSVL